MHPALFEQKSWPERLKIVFWIVIILGAALVVVIVLRGQRLLIRTPTAYQAVFLDNGQVYFGKLAAVNRDFLSLTDIYYLRAGSIQQGGQTEGQIDLIKLGAELHAPRDEMIINKAHVLFYEDLNETGEVLRLIRKHKTGG
ncbi:MAG: hypothetical protein HY398_02720 [Candidatus Doudnabacteria bacterium]|nr:hypothetical protein [Candidatus Doudnabacteria bacterium]